MANVIQAAKWMSEGRTVTRFANKGIPNTAEGLRLDGDGGIVCSCHNRLATFMVTALLGDDWEVVTDQRKEGEL